MDSTLRYAQQQDVTDEISYGRDLFHIPRDSAGNDAIYLCGNSLGLMPKSATKYVTQVMNDWKDKAVDGYFYTKEPWISYHDFLSSPMSEIVGALPSEVTIMNSLTVNLHLLMVSFYRPTRGRYKILFDHNPFPSDRYAIESQVKFHGFDPKDALIELTPKDGQDYVHQTDIEDIIKKHGNEIALILIGGVNYYTGQIYDIPSITSLGHAYGCMVGFDLAHAAGNIPLHLHDDGPDFATWCTYKYLNAGPGSLAGIFVHQRHHQNQDLPRFAGWWGHRRETRFAMSANFDPSPSAEGWQLSCQPVMQMAPIRASLEIFNQVGMEKLRHKSQKLTNYLEFLIQNMDNDLVRIITPQNASHRGSQLSIQMGRPDKKLFTYLLDKGVVVDWREPDVIRAAPVPLYNSYQDVWNFYRILNQGLQIL